MIDGLKQLNPILLSVLVLLIGGMLTIFWDFRKDVNEKLDTLMIQDALGRAMALQDDKRTDLLGVRISKLENGQAIATRDRWTKTEALAANEKERVWIEKYFERKQR